MNRFAQTWKRWSLVTLIALTSLAGCDQEKVADEKEDFSSYPQGFLRKEWPQAKGGPSATIHRTYRIREADQLEVIYFVRTFKAEETYRIKIRDVISVYFPFNKELEAESAEVQSDGRVYLKLLNGVEVFDRTLGEVQQDLTQKYAKYLKDPVLTVNLKESKREIDDLREAIVTSPRGQSRLVPVTPGGRIALPLIGSVLAVQKTVDELQRDIQKRYREMGLQELEVTVNMQTIAPLRVYVMGEVNRPGIIMNETGTPSGLTHLTLLQAIAQAGSYHPQRAELSKVMLVRRKDVPAPQVAVVNLFQLFENQAKNKDKNFVPNTAAFRRDIWLEDGDVIYVPTKTIAKRADYIEYVWTRGIWAVIPMSFSLTGNYNANDVVDWLGPNP